MQIRPGAKGYVVAFAIAAITGAFGLRATDAQAQQLEAEYDPFVRDRARVSIGAGLSVTNDDTYLRLGAGVGYYLIDGLEIGIDTDLWLIGDPTVWNVTPGLLYVFHLVPTLKPYVGTFYRHAFVFDAEDLDSIGARAGAYFVQGRVYFGAGVVYERWLDCNGSTLIDCDEIYPELVLAFSF